ncbi:hypothetical protein A2165_03650, partial [Candidatus Curtissbacteria bacterium RBG_13_40_7]
MGLVLNFIFMFAVPVLTAEYQNTQIFRSWQDPLMWVFFAYPFILGIVAAYLWDIVEGKLKGKGNQKALDFAKLYFVIATIPGMFITYTSFQVSLLMVIAWTITG